MHPTMRPTGRRPNYAVRRLVALTALVLVALALLRVVGWITGGDDDPDVATGGPSSTSTSMPLRSPPACEYVDEPTAYDREEDWFRTIVDTVYAVPEGYRPSDLVPASEANYSAEYQIRALVADDLNALRNGILEAGVPEVAVLAAFRSVEDQAALFAAREQEMGFDAAADGTARPGHSEHHLGTTIDFRPIGETDVDQAFGETPTGQWLAERSWEYGFVLSYPRGKADVTCYKWEPWHFRYVGRDLARRVHDSGLTLREYLWHWEVTGGEPNRPLSAPGTSPTSTSTTTTSVAEASG